VTGDDRLSTQPLPDASCTECGPMRRWWWSVGWA